MATAILSWSPVAGSTGYLIEYKQATSNIWITPSSPANPTLLTTYPLTVTAGVLYNVRLSTFCASGNTTYRYVDVQAPNPVTYVWVPDTYTCEQDDVFTLALTVTGLSSPGGLLYDQTTSRYYVIDQDDVTSNFWWFNPATFTSAAGRNYVLGQPGGVNAEIQAFDVDVMNRRLLAAGPNTGGLIAYTISTNTFVTVPFGVNGPFARLLVRVLGTNIYCSDAGAPATINIINRNSLTLTSTIDITTIPSGSLYFNNSYDLHLVAGNIWCTAGAGRLGAGAGNIAVYNSTLTSLITTITVPGAATWTAGSGAYWQSHYFDESNDRWYVHDIGSNTLHVINTTNNTVVYTKTFINLQGKTNANFVVALNTVTNDLYGSYFGLNSPSDTSQIKRFYKINRTTFEFENMVVNNSVSSLTNRIGTNEFWAVAPNAFKWIGGSWSTDGQAFKYTI
jgi:hypothetical protein